MRRLLVPIAVAVGLGALLPAPGALAALPSELDVRRREPARPIVAPETPRDREGDLLLRVNGTARVPRGERISSVVVIEGDALVRGVVRDSLVVVNGDAVVEGHVLGDATVVNGTLWVRSSGRVGHASLIDGRVLVEPGAQVRWIEESRTAEWRGSLRWVSFFAWVGLTVLAIVAGLVFAAVGYRPLRRSIGELVRHPGATAIGVLVALFAIPLVSIPLLMSGIFTPVGIGLLFGVVPVLAVLGYLVTGTALGLGLVRWFRRRPQEGRPFLAATLGLLLLQVIGLIPVVGAVVMFFASLVGAGALLALAWRAAREAPGEPHPASAAAV